MELCNEKLHLTEKAQENGIEKISLSFKSE